MNSLRQVARRASPPRRPAARRWVAAAALAAILGAGTAALAHDMIPPVPHEQPRALWPKDRPARHDVVVPVLLTISAQGHVTEATVEASLGIEFDTAALAVARAWIFTPAHSDGENVSSKIRAVIRFVGSPNAPEAIPAPIPAGSAPAASGSAASSASTPPATPPTPIHALGHGEEHKEIRIVGERTPPRSASEVVQDRRVLQAAPHRTANDLLLTIPGVYITQHSGEGKAYQIFFRGFDAVHGQDVEIWAGGAPVNDVSNLHGQGYADLHFLPPEVVKQIRSTPGNYDPRQGDFAVAGTIRLDLGYDEPGATVKVGVGQFNTRRYFLAYRPEDAPEGTFAAFELYSTDGFGPSRAARRVSAVGQKEFSLGEETTARLLLTTYATRFDSPGVLRLSDIEKGKIDRFGSYDEHQGGDASRSQAVLEFNHIDETSRWTFAPYAILRSMGLRQDYTGYLQQPFSGTAAEVAKANAATKQGNSEQQINEATSLGFTSFYRRIFPVFAANDTFEIGMSARSDWITQSQKRLSIDTSQTTLDEVGAKIRATDVAGYVDLALHPIKRVTVRGGARIDALAYAIEDDGGAGQGERRAAQGAHIGKKGTLEVRLVSGLAALASYGDGFRSPQARSLQQAQNAPFTTVQSYETGLRYLDTGIRATASVFRTLLSDDLVFDQATARNERTPPTRRTGITAEMAATPEPFFTSSASITYTRAEFTNTDGGYNAGDLVPYAPQLVVRSDISFSPTLGTVAGRPLTGKLGAGLTFLDHRPLPYGEVGHDVLLIDSQASLRLKEVQFSAEAYNLLDAQWYDGEYVFASNFQRNSTPSLVPQRHVTTGAPRTVLFTLSLFL